MEHLPKHRLLDPSGHPISARVEDVLADLVPRCRRQFPALRDDVALTEVLEEAGRRIANREQRSGPLEKLHGYAWVTLRSVATSWMRRGSNRIRQKTLESDEGRAALADIPAESGSPEQIEGHILFKEGVAHLTPHESLVCASKLAGFSSEEIARQRGCSVAAVDTVFSRARQKIRRALGVQDSNEAAPHNGG